LSTQDERDKLVEGLQLAALRVRMDQTDAPADTAFAVYKASLVKHCPTEYVDAVASFDTAQSGHSVGCQSLHSMARLFAVFSFVLALSALFSFWPPKSTAVIVWLLLWTTVCLATGIAVLRRARYAPALVWTLNILAGLSAVSALSSGLLRGVRILIDILLFVPLVWFAFWYQRRRREESATTGPFRPSQ
jgi:hypothetical protein